MIPCVAFSFRNMLTQLIVWEGRKLLSSKITVLPAKCTSWHARPRKTQISLRIIAVWSESTMDTIWVANSP